MHIDEEFNDVIDRIYIQVIYFNYIFKKKSSNSLKVF